MVAAQDDASALAAIATVGTTVGIVFHMTKVHRAFTALARATINLNVVYKVTFH